VPQGHALALTAPQQCFAFVLKHTQARFVGAHPRPVHEGSQCHPDGQLSVFGCERCARLSGKFPLQCRPLKIPRRPPDLRAMKARKGIGRIKGRSTTKGQAHPRRRETAESRRRYQPSQGVGASRPCCPTLRSECSAAACRSMCWRQTVGSTARTFSGRGADTRWHHSHVQSMLLCSSPSVATGPWGCFMRRIPPPAPAPVKHLGSAPKKQKHPNAA
jgi:hypothetical protein